MTPSSGTSGTPAGIGVGLSHYESNRFECRHSAQGVMRVCRARGRTSGVGTRSAASSRKPSTPIGAGLTRHNPALGTCLVKPGKRQRASLALEKSRERRRVKRGIPHFASRWVACGSERDQYEPQRPVILTSQLTMVVQAGWRGERFDRSRRGDFDESSPRSPAPHTAHDDSCKRAFRVLQNLAWALLHTPSRVRTPAPFSSLERLDLVGTTLRPPLRHARPLVTAFEHRRNLGKKNVRRCCALPERLLPGQILRAESRIANCCFPLVLG